MIHLAGDDDIPHLDIRVQACGDAQHDDGARRPTAEQPLRTKHSRLWSHLPEEGDDALRTAVRMFKGVVILSRLGVPLGPQRLAQQFLQFAELLLEGNDDAQVHPGGSHYRASWMFAGSYHLGGEVPGG